MQNMTYFDDVTKENIKGHHPNWPQTPGYPHRVLIIGGFGPEKTNLISQELDSDNIYSYAQYLFEAKCKFLINKRKSTGLKYFNDAKAFIELQLLSNYMDHIYENIEEYNSNKKRKILIAFDDMITDMLMNKNRNKIVTELFIRGRKLNIFLIFIM